jgi:hypothetical protein
MGRISFGKKALNAITLDKTAKPVDQHDAGLTRSAPTQQAPLESGAFPTLLMFNSIHYKHRDSSFAICKT